MQFLFSFSTVNIGAKFKLLGERGKFSEVHVWAASAMDCLLIGPTRKCPSEMVLLIDLGCTSYKKLSIIHSYHLIVNGLCVAGAVF